MATNQYRLIYDSETPCDREDYGRFDFGDLKYELAYGSCSEDEENKFAYNFYRDGWEQYSLPIGNGYFGANVFGRVEKERLQITENSLSNPYVKRGYHGGLNNFLELFVTFPHDNVTGYERSLDLERAVATVSYDYDKVHYQREYFASYPAKTLVCHFSASEKGSLSFEVEAQIPYLCNGLYEENDGYGKTGNCHTWGDEICASGEMEFYGILYEAIVKVQHEGGTLNEEKGKLCVRDCDSATIIAVFGTNYQMKPEVFMESEHQLKLKGYPHPHEKLRTWLDAASNRSYMELMQEHEEDYKSLFNRVEISLGKKEDVLFDEDKQMCTDQLVVAYREGKRSTWLEELYFQYGRYLLISCSRPGTYPANLQGTWNKYQVSPWSSGYWHNINVQMNYWPAFNTNLCECLEPYERFFHAYLPLAEQIADHYVRDIAPDKKAEDGENGWTICTGAWLYTLCEDPLDDRHSGLGVGGFTAQLIWESYAFTKDERILKETVYPALRGACLFFSKIIMEKDGLYLMPISASPEQTLDDGTPYLTEGCAFDQQMVYECYKNYLQVAALLDVDDDLTEMVKQQIDHLEPALIGLDGQIKEYREENHYGDIGDKHHRHISHLVGLYPGNLITSHTPELLEAAKVSLDRRGDYSTGWGTAHRLNAWARVKNGNRAYVCLKNLLQTCTYPNLWDAHPPFQIDGNFGGCSGIAEMLLQSHEEYIHVIPALPDAWKTGSFKGLTARGGFVVDALWEEYELMELSVLSNKGGTLCVLGNYKVLCDSVEVISNHIDGVTCVETQEGKRYDYVRVE